eukprot:874560_1
MDIQVKSATSLKMFAFITTGIKHVTFTIGVIYLVLTICYYADIAFTPNQQIKTILIASGSQQSNSTFLQNKTEKQSIFKQNAANLTSKNEYVLPYEIKIPTGFKMDKILDFRPINISNFETFTKYKHWKWSKMAQIKNIENLDFWSDKLVTYDCIGHLVPTISILFKSNIDGSWTTKQADALLHLLINYNYKQYGSLILKPTHLSWGWGVQKIDKYDPKLVEQIFHDMYQTMYINNTEGWNIYRQSHIQWYGYYSVPRIVVMEAINKVLEIRAYTVFGRSYAIHTKYRGIAMTITRDGKCTCIRKRKRCRRKYKQKDKKSCFEVLKSFNLKQFVKMTDELAFIIGMDFVRLDFFVLKDGRFVFNELEVISGAKTRTPVEILYELWTKVTDEHFVKLSCPRRTEIF